MSTIAQQMGPPYEGVPCFCRMPMCFDLNALEADVAVLGICLDTGTSNRSGARYGPRAIREASMLYSAGYVPKQGFFDIELGRPILATTRIVDCGDIPTLPTLMTETFDGITESIRAVRSRGAVPVVLGGDHSISFPVLRAFADTPLRVVHFDAHLDLMDDFMGIRYSHANPMKRIAELEHIIGLTQIGIRGLLNGLLGAEKKAHYFTAEDVRQRGEEFVASQIPQSENIYISVDIDCLDPSVAPGTGTPEPGGLTYLQLRALLRACAGKGRLVGMDLVEVNPLFDPTGITANVAARLILDALGAAKG